MECNEPLCSIEKEKAEGRVPTYVFQTQKEFSWCPDCQKIYWKGTHWILALEKLEALKKD